MWNAALLAQLALAPPHVAATRTSTPPVVDGRLDDAVWQAAPSVTAFTQKFPDEGEAPSDPTTMRVLYDDENIYVAFECVQKHSPVVERLTRRDRIVEADRVTISIGSRSDRKTAYDFTVGASGSLADIIRYDDTETSADWDENWDARTARTEVGWTAELMIPLRILRFAEGDESWDFQARRYISDRQETDEWAFIPRSEAGEVSRYGFLDDLRGLTPSSPLELRPFVVGRFRNLEQGSTGLASGTDWKVSAGLDLKWHPTNSLVLDATFNPDFAQVEADERVLNLTTFETYYPEKRPFFLEGIDLFSTPRQLLYTRRIGRGGQSPELRTAAPFGERLVDLAAPATIYGASKLVGSIADKWQIATLQAITGRNDVLVEGTDGIRSRRLVDPLTAYQALRIKRELPGNGYLGFMATTTTHAEPSSEYPLAPAAPGTTNGILCPNGVTPAFGGRCFNDAYVGSADFRWRSKDGEWVTGAQLIGTMLRNGPPRAVRDGTVIHSGDVGTGAFAYLNKEGGKHWVGYAQLEYEGKKLDYNDLGFNQRANDYRFQADVEYRELEKWWHFLESRVKTEIRARTNLAGLVIGQAYQLNASAKLTNFWNVFTEVHWRPRYYDDREVGDGTALQRGGLFGYELELATDPTQRVSFKMFSQTQLVSNRGFIENADAGLLFRVLPQLDLELLPTLVWTTGEPRYAGPGPTNGQYVFGKLSAKAIGTVLRATYTFTPRLTLQTFGQLFLASGNFSELTAIQTDPASPRPVVHLGDLQPFTGTIANPDFQQGALNVNVVLRWEYALGSTIYLVYSRSQIPAVTLQGGEEAHFSLASVRRAPAADVIFAKLSYFWASR
jgi:hypothetical protein